MSDKGSVHETAEQRHARVLPSFAVRFVGHKLDCSLGKVDARELLAWPGSSLPSGHTARQLREQFVRRKRSHFERLWESEIGVKIVDEWRRALDDTERLRMITILTDEGAIERFPRMTLREVKESLRLSVADTLGVLAKLEALYWVALPGQSPTARRWAPTSWLEDVAVEEEFRESVRTTLEAPWITELEPNDLRFPSVNGEPFAQWMRHQVDKPKLPAAAVALCKRAIEAQKAPWARELESIAEAALETAKPGPGSDTTKKRWIAIFAARYGGQAGLELQGVGDRFGITSERVRQICDSILRSIAAHAVKAPALDRLLAAAARILPLTVDEADTQLVKFLGEGAGILAAMDFAQVLGQDSPVRAAFAKARTSTGYKPVQIVEATSDPASDWVNTALTHARRDCTFVGCTNFVRIAGFLALEKGVAQDLETLQSVFSKAPGYRMLDEESGWFTLADSENSAAASRVRKLMAVGPRSLDLDTIAAALMTDDRWFYRDGGRSMAIPPLHVFAELLAGWLWLSANRHHKYTLLTPIDGSDVLSKAEAAALHAINGHASVATRAEIAAHMMGTVGMSNMSVSFVLGSSPAFVKLDHAIYGIRGHAIPAEALIAARRRRHLEQLSSTSGAEDVVLDIDPTAPLRTTVTQSRSTDTPARRVVYLPSYLAEVVKGDFTHAGGQLPSIGVKQNLQIRHLSIAAAQLGIAPGDRFPIVFDVPNRTYDIPMGEVGTGVGAPHAQPT